MKIKDGKKPLYIAKVLQLVEKEIKIGNRLLRKTASLAKTRAPASLR
ncbi:hypothetical protein [Metaplanococcus flavidus]|uniref:Uncharacterized protein n=1 Tax=Metaplanococcus flavidus TaxID=569883 RepID=A0ABW3LHK0_9BACL